MKGGAIMLICLDTETTGLEPGYDEIIDLAIVDRNGEKIFSELIKPSRRKKWPEAEKVNRISPEMVKDKLTFRHFRDRVQEIINTADCIVGYNLDFDLDFLTAAGIELRGTEQCEYIDVMLDFAPLYGEWNDFFNGWKWQKLTVCAKRLGYQWTAAAHGALADAQATMICHWRLEDLKKRPDIKKIYKERLKRASETENW